MSDEPTIQAGESADEEWVKYLKGLLNGQGADLDDTGEYDETTQEWVKYFQGQQGLPADGIVNEKTWAALRGEGAGDSEGGGEPQQEGVRLDNVECMFVQEDDLIWFWATSVGTEEPESGTIQPYMQLTSPDGSTKELQPEHTATGDRVHEWRSVGAIDGKAGEYVVFFQLPEEVTGGGHTEFTFTCYGDEAEELDEELVDS